MMSKRASAPPPGAAESGDDLAGRPVQFADALRRFLRPLPAVESAAEEVFLASFLRQADSLASASAIARCVQLILG